MLGPIDPEPPSEIEALASGAALDRDRVFEREGLFCRDADFDKYDFLKAECQCPEGEAE